MLLINFIKNMNNTHLSSANALKTGQINPLKLNCVCFILKLGLKFIKQFTNIENTCLEKKTECLSHLG